MLFADDIVLIEDSPKYVNDRLEQWKEVLDSKLILIIRKNIKQETRPLKLICSNKDETSKLIMAFKNVVMSEFRPSDGVRLEVKLLLNINFYILHMSN